MGQLLYRAQRVLETFQVLRFLVSAGVAALANLGTLYLLADIIQISYVTASIIAFISGFIVAFLLHKGWTFKAQETGRAPQEILLAAMMKLINFVTYVGGVYAMVEWLGLWHMYAAMIAGAAIPLENFLAFKYVVFRRPSCDPS